MISEVTDTIIFRDCAVYGGFLYFITEFPYSIPMRFDLQSRIFSLWNIQDAFRMHKALYDKVIVNGDRLYAVSDSVDIILKYELCEHKVVFQDTGFFCEKEGVACIDIAEEKLFIFGRKKGLVVYDINTESIASINYPNPNEIYHTGIGDAEGYYLFPRKGGTIIFYDKNSRAFVKKEVKGFFYKAVDALSDGGAILLLRENGQLFKMENGSLSEILIDWGDIDVKRMSFSRFCITEKSYILLPFMSNEIIKIDQDTSKAIKMGNYPSDFQYQDNQWLKYYGHARDESNIIFAPRTGNYFPSISIKNDGIDWIRAEAASGLRYKFSSMNRQVSYETSEAGLREMIDALTL